MNAVELNQRGVQKANQRDFVGAAEDWSEAISLDPTCIGAHLNLARLCQESHCSEKALSHYSHAIALDATLASAYYDRGTVYQATGKFTAAVNDYTQALAIAPDLIEAYLNRGIVLAESGNVQAAIADFNQVIQRQPQAADAYFNRGKARYLMGEMQAAIADLKQSVQFNPDDAEVYSFLGRIYCEERAVYSAIQVYLQAAHCYGQDTEAHRTHALTDAVELHQYGGLTCSPFQQQDWNIALTVFEQQLKHVMLNGYGSSVYGFFQQGDRQSILQFLRQHLDLTSEMTLTELRDLERLLTDIGFSHQQLNQFDAAYHAYDLAAIIHNELLDPNHPDAAIALYHLGRLYQTRNDLQAAWTYLTTALSLWKKVLQKETSDYISYAATCLQSCGEIFLLQGQIYEARQNFTQALELRQILFHSNGVIVAESLISLGELCMAQNDMSAAKNYFEQALQAYRTELDETHPIVQQLTNQLIANRELVHQKNNLCTFWQRLHHFLAFR